MLTIVINGQQLEADKISIMEGNGIVYNVTEHPDGEGGLRLAVRGDVTTIVAPNSVIDILPSKLLAARYIVF